MIEYAILFFLFFRAFLSLHSSGLSLTKVFGLAIFFSVIFAASDEFHQTFVYSRQGTIRDVVIDTLGIFIMFFCVKINIHFFKKILLWKK